jgi:hypothetical protein
MQNGIRQLRGERRWIEGERDVGPNMSFVEYQFGRAEDYET